MENMNLVVDVFALPWAVSVPGWGKPARAGFGRNGAGIMPGSSEFSLVCLRPRWLLGQVTRGHSTLLLPCRTFLQLLCSLAALWAVLAGTSCTSL